ncbi:hypothetical protein COY29_06035 [Candidatus Woesebacteria bacterium CG_4_10_14_0_2_um_filter_39_14]|uniref:Uncharacterized protein n=3 Tax=Microgenomates group TaxID=1794810 RepID=A0A2M6YQK8_9BACT|nr:MAG: hypothetical protein COT04_00290 [Candidatus Shapirobacteria bacterium CG07_land_8_20_14_0_80_39_12]PIZ46828.1 MAG: hypothetical protein COY29_06035 [Candidatus Woesebacteria bacterium CG_4_10_14_0_2_um_filter_39_14]PJA49612.1 MAG: hypothetical protein CO169_01555 [Candidatus Shapirobacteria bacterium CG_4_9_14_3_um_filter_39_13]
MALPSKETIISEHERIPVVERSTKIELTPEIKRVEPVIGGEEITLPQAVMDDTGAVILDNIAPQQVAIKLPLTEEEMNQALHLKIIYSFRWLAEWTKRVLKILGGKFIYRF